MKGQENLLISIIMPIHNRQESAKKAVESILNQTYPFFELIIVNDASMDNTGSIIQSFNDRRIRYIFLEQKIGAAAARNIGVKEAQGSWIAFQDSDDYWLPDKLEKQVRQALKYRDGLKPIIYTGFNRHKEGKVEYIPQDDGRKKSGFIHKELLLGNFVSTQTVMLPRECFEVAGNFDEELPRFQDWELWIRMSLKYPFILIDESLVDVFYSKESISSDQGKMIHAYQIIIQKHSNLFQAAGSKYNSSIYFSLGHNLCLIGRIREGRKLLLQAINLYPRSFQYFLTYFSSIFGATLYQIVYKLYNRK